MKMIPKTNESGEVISNDPAPYDALKPIKDDENAEKKDTSLTLDPNNAAGFAATAAVMKATNDVKTSGIASIGSDDADAMTIASKIALDSIENN